MCCHTEEAARLAAGTEQEGEKEKKGEGKKEREGSKEEVEEMKEKETADGSEAELRSSSDASKPVYRLNVRPVKPVAIIII